MPLEGLWWADDMTKFTVEDKSNWKWTMMILMPEFVTDDMYNEGRDEAFRQKGNEYINKIRSLLLRV